MRKQVFKQFEEVVNNFYKDVKVTPKQSEITFDCYGGGEWNGRVNQDGSNEYWMWEVDVERDYASLTVKEYEDFLSNGKQIQVEHTEEIKDFLNNVKHLIHFFTNQF